VHKLGKDDFKRLLSQDWIRNKKTTKPFWKSDVFMVFEYVKNSELGLKPI